MVPEESQAKITCLGREEIIVSISFCSTSWEDLEKLRDFRSSDMGHRKKIKIFCLESTTRQAALVKIVPILRKRQLIQTKSNFMFLEGKFKRAFFKLLFLLQPTAKIYRFYILYAHIYLPEIYFVKYNLPLLHTMNSDSFISLISFYSILFHSF